MRLAQPLIADVLEVHPQLLAGTALPTEEARERVGTVLAQVGRLANTM